MPGDFLPIIGMLGSAILSAALAPKPPKAPSPAPIPKAPTPAPVPAAPPPPPPEPIVTPEDVSKSQQATKNMQKRQNAAATSQPNDLFNLDSAGSTVSGKSLLGE